MLRIRARVQVRPTEDAEKVRAALQKLFPDGTVEPTSDGFLVQAPTMDRLRELVRSQRIPDTARGVMLGGLTEDGLVTRFRLGKQAAAAGRAHFGALGSALGEVEVELEGDAPGEVERAVYRMAPDTTVSVELSELPPSDRLGLT